jgi:tetratricopeptide (TPR) repeat protein
MMKLRRFEDAESFMQVSRKALEPLPGCEWSERHEWHGLRRDLYKNLAVLHQSQDNWQLAFDNLRMVITHEKRIGDNTANTQLTCGVLLSKMGRFAESIEFAQEASNEVEKVLGITLARPLQDYRYTGKQREVMEEKDKQFTTYAIANHLIAKSLMNLQYFKEARHFLQKASTAVSKCLNQPKKDLQVAIGNDLARLT